MRAKKAKRCRGRLTSFVVVIVAALAACTSQPLPTGESSELNTARDWCHSSECDPNTNLENCLKAAQGDHADYKRYTGEDYSNCRNIRTLARGLSPSGDLVVSCKLPSGKIVAVNIDTCRSNGWTVVQ